MILLTGANGFLGKHILSSFKEKEDFLTLGRSASNFKCDIVKQVPNNLPKLQYVIHAAGKAHFIPKTQEESRYFFDVNVTGAANLLKGLENSGLPKSFIFISSVSVYGVETGLSIPEEYPLKAQDPYGKSKIDAEKLIWDWCEKNKVTCAILRLPLIAGANPPGNLRVMINSIKKGYYFNVGGGKAKKSIVLAEDVARIIPAAAKIGGIYNLTDQYHPSFLELSGIIAKQLGRPQPLNIPLWLAKLMAKGGDLVGTKAPINSGRLIKITSDLTFDDTKAQKLLGWKPTKVLNNFKII